MRHRPRRSDPHAAGQCDRCAFVFERRKLKKQNEFRGNRLVWTGWYVCPGCLDKPFELDRPIRIPADPPPIKDPRFEQ